MTWRPSSRLTGPSRASMRSSARSWARLRPRRTMSRGLASRTRPPPQGSQRGVRHGFPGR
eukprot:13143734-Heterocapsa_arctica.AAC.1